MFKNELKEIILDLGQHHRKPPQLLKMYIEERLNNSISVYYSSLIENCNSIMNIYGNSIRSIKKVISNL